MSKSVSLEVIVNQIETLDYDSKLSLLERLVSLIRRKKSPDKISLTDLNGLGSEIWKDVDIANYVSRERQWD